MNLSLILTKFQSRKFIVTVAVGCIVVFGRALGLNLDEKQLYDLVALALAYLGVQGAVDLKNGASTHAP